MDYKWGQFILCYRNEHTIIIIIIIITSTTDNQEVTSLQISIR